MAVVSEVVVHVIQEESWVIVLVGAATGVGTLALALFTWRLARSTTADLEAQWRPLLVPTELHIRMYETATGTVSLMPMEPSGGWWALLSDLGEFVFAFENVGKGAALAVRGTVPNPPGTKIMYSSCDDLANPVLAVGAKVAFRKAEASIAENQIRVNVAYNDLAGNAYETVAYYQRLKGNSDWRVRFVVPARTLYLKGMRLFLVKLRWWLAAPLRWVRSVVCRLARMVRPGR